MTDQEPAEGPSNARERRSGDRSSSRSEGRASYVPRDGARKPYPKRDGDRSRSSGASGDRKPYANRDGERKPYANRDGDRKPYAPRDGERKPYGNRDGDRKPYSQRDGERKPYGNRDGDRKPYAQRDGERKPYGNRDGDPKPYAQRDGERKPYGNRGGDRKPYSNRDGDRKPYGNRDGDRRPYPQRDGDRKPYGNRDGDRKSYGSRERDGESYPRRGAGGPRPTRGGAGRPDRATRPEEIRSIRPDHDDPWLPDEVTPQDLNSGARNELKTLSKENAEWVARHLAMAAQLIDEDPALAHRHALSASRRAGRIAVVRETLAITAYATGDFALALRELRTYRRISGSDAQIALLVDSARGVGRPDRALEAGRAADRSALPTSVRVELAIAMSGARLDLGEPTRALAELDIPELDPDRAFEWSPALFSARAEVLEELGRADEAAVWRRRADVAADALFAASGAGDLETIEIDEIEEIVLPDAGEDIVSDDEDVLDGDAQDADVVEDESEVSDEDGPEGSAEDEPEVSVEDEVAEILADADVDDADEDGTA